MKKVKRMLRVGRILRYRAYKKAGIVRHRKHLDRMFRVAFLFVVALYAGTLLAILKWTWPQIAPSTQPAEAVQEEAEQRTFAVQPVSDQVQLYNKLKLLEQKAHLSEINLTRLTLNAANPLDTLLSKQKIAPEERRQIIDAFSKMIKLNTIRTGTVFYLFTDVEGQFLGLTLYLSNNDVMAVIKQGDQMVTLEQTNHVKSQLERKEETVNGALSKALKSADIPASIITDIQGVLNEVIDLYGSVQKGDTFDVVMEQRVTAGGLELNEKRLSFVGLKSPKKNIYRYAFNEKGNISYYDPEGKSTPKMLLKRPVQGKTRISSPFGNRRHPILMYNVFHKGVDYAAKLNTPVVAAMDGVIMQIGRNGSYGKYIKIRHDGGYQTAYAHLNGYKKGLAVGSRVKKNQVIAYVGNTGRSTGPHLHFEVLSGGKVVHPLKNNMIQGRKLTGATLQQFQQQARKIHPDFDRHLFGKLPPIPARRPNFATSLGTNQSEVAQTLGRINERVFKLRK